MGGGGISGSAARHSQASISQSPGCHAIGFNDGTDATLPLSPPAPSANESLPGPMSSQSVATH